MIYVIADIHGEYEKLRRLVDFLEKDAQEYIFLGDFIDKGKKSKETVNLLIDLSKSKKCVFLTGDHEYVWRKYFDENDIFLNFLLSYGGIRTLESYLGRNLTLSEAKTMLANKEAVRKLLEMHLHFYSNLKFYYEVNNEFLCVHAGVNPENKDKPLEFHNKEELVFIRDKFIHSKFLYRGRKIIFGHTAFREPYVDNYKIGIDTGATYEDMGYGDLVAFNIIKKEFINHRGEVKDYNIRSNE